MIGVSFVGWKYGWFLAEEPYFKERAASRTAASQGFVPLSCPPLQDCRCGKTGNDSAFQLPAQTTLQLLILIS